MQKTADFLDAIKARYELTSDYQIWKLMGGSPSRIGSYRSGRSKFDQATCIQVAQLLELEPGYVMACIEAERSVDPAIQSVWKKVATTIRATAAAGILGLIALPIGGDLPAANAPYPTDLQPKSGCILCQIRIRIWQTIMRWLGLIRQPAFL